MELKTQRPMPSMTSRWHPILLGIMLGLFISAIFTSNYANRTTTAKTPISTAASSSSFSSSPFLALSPWSPSTLSNHLFILLMRRNDSLVYIPKTEQKSSTKAATPSPSSPSSSSPSTSSSSSSSPSSSSSSSSSQSIALLTHINHNAVMSEQPTSSSRYCDISKGKWVEEMEGSVPFYDPGTCPFVGEGFDCHGNGRVDTKYMRWRWAPSDCNMPKFNSTHMLHWLRGKRLVFVGDSLNRNQWESMLCMLREALVDKRRIVQIHGGSKVSKIPGAYAFKFLDYDCKVEFYTSPYLVDQEVASNATQPIIRLDRMDRSERRWRKADVLVFNTGHWWTPDKIGDGVNCFQEGSRVHERLDVMVAYKKALSTWAKWVDKYVNPNHTNVIFRAYSPVHYIGGQWNSGGQCQNEVEPIYNDTYLSPYPSKMKVLEEEIMPTMRVPVHVLNITRLSDYRKDGHPALFGQPLGHMVSHQDCSHWCLPGVPDTWNELLYFSLLKLIPL